MNSFLFKVRYKYQWVILHVWEQKLTFIYTLINLPLASNYKNSRIIANLFSLRKNNWSFMYNLYKQQTLYLVNK